MSLTVKEGREYVLGGKVYKPGETVEGVQEKFIPILTGHKGPLTRGPASNRTDLPKAKAKVTPVVAQPEPEAPDETGLLREEYEKLLGKRAFNGWDASELRRRMAEYQRSDMEAAPAGEYLTTHMVAEE